MLVACGWALALVAAASVGWWAASQTMRPPTAQTVESEQALYEVAEGTVGRTVPFTATASWTRELVATQTASGTVTRVQVDAGASIEAGDVLYAVDERPVAVAVGQVPAYRDMGPGDRGEDVAQLQRLLRDLDLYDGADDGRFGAATARAVALWQDDLGIEDDSVVRRGDLLFVPELPSPVVLAEGIEVGREATTGSDAVWALSSVPDFQVVLGADQRDLVPLSAEVLVYHQHGRWAAQIESSYTDDVGDLVLVLEGAGGGPVCGEECTDVVSTADVSTQFRAEIVVVPDTTGPIVPAAAMHTDASGQVTVTLEGGEPREVEVIAADAGQAVVSGLKLGETIRLFGDDEPDG